MGTLKEFTNVLLAEHIHVFIDYKTLHTAILAQITFTGGIYCKIYGPEIRFIKGDKNAAANALNWLPIEITIPK